MDFSTKSKNNFLSKFKNIICLFSIEENTAQFLFKKKTNNFLVKKNPLRKKSYLETAK